jgi:hypothetical protein
MISNPVFMNYRHPILRVLLFHYENNYNNLLEVYGISKENILENEKYLTLLADTASVLQNFLIVYEQTVEKK